MIKNSLIKFVFILLVLFATNSNSSEWGNCANILDSINSDSEEIEDYSEKLMRLAKELDSAKDEIKYCMEDGENECIYRKQKYIDLQSDFENIYSKLSKATKSLRLAKENSDSSCSGMERKILNCQNIKEIEATKGKEYLYSLCTQEGRLHDCLRCLSSK